MIEIVFISSSRTKFAHIEYLLKDSNYFISQQRNYGIGYIEPRIYDREKLLKDSYEDAKTRFKKSVSNAEDKFFMLEDTSVVIDALSDIENEVPGLDIKYWMKEHSFDDIDRLLKKNNNNRKCTVRSDIILHLPRKLQEKHHKEYMIFTGKSEGYICKKENEFEINPLYPWLDNKTFNKWFVPIEYKEEDMSISQLDIDEASKDDFRKNAIDKMIEFLEQEELLEYEKQQGIKKSQKPSLFDSAAFVLLGSTCAGKSTLAEYMADKYGYYHIEASDFMHLEYHKTHGVNSSVNIGDFAQKALEDNPNIVVKQVVEFCNKIRSKPIVVSGFRTHEEVKYFKTEYIKQVKVLFVDTKQGIRYERCKERDRRDVAITLDKFKIKDAQQYAMGIYILENTIEDRISNNEIKNKYYSYFEEKYGYLINKHHELVVKRELEDMRLEEFILLALYEHFGEFFTTTEIAGLINTIFFQLKPKSKNNVSRYFNQHFHPYYDIEVKDGVNKYAINSTGKSQIRYIAESLKSELL